MFEYITNMIKRAALLNDPIDDREFQIGQIGYLETITNVEVFHPYGFGSRPPIGSYCITFTIQGQEEHQFVLAGTPDLRIKNLQPGESYFANLLSGTNILNKENGDMQITVKNDSIEIISGNKTVSVDQDLTITVTGDIIINASGSVQVNSDSIDLGTSGPAIARVGDQISVTVPSTPGTFIGTITTGSSNARAA